MSSWQCPFILLVLNVVNFLNTYFVTIANFWEVTKFLNDEISLSKNIFTSTKNRCYIYVFGMPKTSHLVNRNQFSLSDENFTGKAFRDEVRF